MVILVGESASGKSTVENILADKYGYEKIISYTSRPLRKNEQNDVDYHFISQEEFEIKMDNNFFAEVGVYNNWYYGTTKEQYKENSVAVLTPHGLRQVRKNLADSNINIIVFYIDVPRRDRLMKIIERGDNVDEAIRRNLSDVGQFDGIEDEVDYIITNAGYSKTPQQIAKLIYEQINIHNIEENNNV